MNVKQLSLKVLISSTALSAVIGIAVVLLGCFSPEIFGLHRDFSAVSAEISAISAFHSSHRRGRPERRRDR